MHTIHFNDGTYQTQCQTKVCLFVCHLCQNWSLHFRGKLWNKTLNYGTPQVFNFNFCLCKKKMIGREKRLRRAIFLLGRYGLGPGILTALFWLKRQLRPPCFRPVFQPQRFFLSLRWPCFGWGGGEVRRRGEGTSTLLVFVQAPRVTNWFTAVDDNIKIRLVEENSSKCMIC